MNKKAFTFVELIVATTIIVILAWIWFYSYSGLLWDSRDSQRKSDLSQVSSALKVYKQKRWYYAIPWDSFNLTFSGITVANQGFLNKNVHLNSLEKLPIDPKTKWYYVYSTTKNKQEFQLFLTLENEEESITLVGWDYKSVSKNLLPVIGIAQNQISWTNIELKDSSNKDYFIFDNQFHNLPYTIEDPYEPYSDWTPFATLLAESEEDDNFWQNTDFRNCTEIKEAWKLIIPLTSEEVEYQIITDTWALINTGCSL
jgi:type II secretory pathway pseudopilin PulG